MSNINMKKLILPNLPYILFVYLFDKVAQAVRLAPGADLSGKLLAIGNGFTAAFASPLPSFHPVDILIGIAGAVVIRLVVYTKGKNAKKYRKGMEYGSARWGNAEDIKPYIDPVFENNVLLTQTERLIYDAYIERITTKEIMASLNITQNTLKFHNKNIYHKLGVSSRKELQEIYQQINETE